jgi:hypothetical protein
MDIWRIMSTLYLIALWAFILSATGLITLASVYLIKRFSKSRGRQSRNISFPSVLRTNQTNNSGLSSKEIPLQTLDNDEDDDITSYETTTDIFRSGRFSAEERRREYIRRGKSPSGFINGVYNDSFRENGVPYNDENRDWEADA